MRLSFRRKKIKLIFLLCITITSVANFYMNWSLSEETSFYNQNENVFVCVRYLSEACPLAKEVAKLLFPNANIKDYTGQYTDKEDILIVVCGCSHAYLFNGLILYVDNGHGNLYLPEVSERKVVYLGSNLPTQSTLVLEHVNIYFSALVATVIYKQSRSNNLLQRQYGDIQRSFIIYYDYYCTQSGNGLFETFLQVANQHGFDIPVEIGNCFGNEYLSSSKYGTSLHTSQNDINILRHFRFAVITEKTNSPGYVTERMFHAFLAGTIPIYYGSNDVFKMFNADSFIYFDPENPQKAIDKLVWLEQNKEAYLQLINNAILADSNQTLREYFSFVDDIGGGLLKGRIFRALSQGKLNFMSDPPVNLTTGLEYTKIKMLVDTFGSKPKFLPFYMYDKREFYKGNWSSSPSCFTDEQTDTALLKIFEKHPWRTDAKSKAKVFIIPIPLIESYQCDYKGHKARVEKAMNTIVANRYYKRYNGRDHLLMAHAWELSAWEKSLRVLSDKWWNKLSEVTTTRYEYYAKSKWENILSYESKLPAPKWLFRKPWEHTKRSLIVPYVTPIDLNVVMPYYDEWKKRPNFVWYHIRATTFYNNSLRLRRLPIRKRDLFPGDIGFSISRGHWISGWSKSKFCFVIRGDTPTSHAFYNELASSCIPVVISDAFDLVGLPFKNLISLESISIRFTEFQFLHAPETLFSFLRKLSDHYMKRKLFNIKTAQAVLVIRSKTSVVPRTNSSGNEQHY